MKRVAIPLLLLALISVGPAKSATQVYPVGTKLGWATITVVGQQRALVRTDIVQGAGEAQLIRGLAHWEETPLPGQGGTVVFSGHRTTWDHPLRDLDVWPKRKTVLRMYMYLPKRQALCYRLASTRIVRETDTSPAYKYRGRELIQTWACHPKGQRTHRIIGYWWQTDCAGAD